MPASRWPVAHVRAILWAMRHEWIIEEADMEKVRSFVKEWSDDPFVIDMDYVDADCFAKPQGPTVVPARTFLSQLI